MTLPEPPWQSSRPPRAVRTPLTRDRIVDAALSLLVEHGYEAVSMRRVAQVLGTGPASLYAHVANKSELDQLLVDRAAQDLVIPDPDPDRWQEQLKEVMRAFLTVLRAYPGVARAALGQVPLGEASMISTERILAILKAGGVPDQAAAWTVDLIPLYICAVAFEETIQGASAWTEDDVNTFLVQLRDYFKSLPGDRFPVTVALAAALTKGAGDERFEFGIHVIVTGIASFVPTTPTDHPTDHLQ